MEISASANTPTFPTLLNSYSGDLTDRTHQHFDGFSQLLLPLYRLLLELQQFLHFLAELMIVLLGDA